MSYDVRRFYCIVSFAPNNQDWFMTPDVIACITLLSIIATLAMMIIYQKPSLNLNCLALAIGASILVFVTIPKIWWMSYKAIPSELAMAYSAIATAWAFYPKKPWIKASGILATLTISWLCGKAFCEAHAGIEYSGKEPVTMNANRITLQSLRDRIQIIASVPPSGEKIHPKNNQELSYFTPLSEEPPEMLPPGWLRNCGVETFETVTKLVEHETIMSDFTATPLWHSWLTGIYHSKYHQPGIWTPGGPLKSAIDQLQLKADPTLPLREHKKYYRQ